ncbi:tRNA (adenosine(37)-N6)-threonylcarbamoyltransferase complex dimerization subunit type 1 TsaB [Microbacterium sp. JZ31]|uniref:tRNA (adenosine(37)-N6)-threonylcarbamoyltransferase complex dimerization subunit type 1 TsaB n=1 Tax=Microbacterium sp. JZ31 TaxID=1906274 RepID=UPI001932DE23|nr:tRNA (adenosine(37)-N6)-threonylcarbamoyltransferase complex dimerization subunit type 1 TsaB [Microbacterium sp. JZ31]
MILAIDTSIGSTVAVVAPDGAVRAVAESEHTLGHAEIIGTLLERVLEESGGEITHVAAGMGPGAFTGLRIGIAAARAFALGRGLAVIPVPSHDAAALAHLDAGASGPFAVVTDARRRENAVTVYDGAAENGLPRRVAGPELRPQTADLASDPLTSGAEIVRAERIRAGDVGRVAALLLASGWRPTGELAETEPLYLRSPDVTVGHAPKRVSA